MSLREVRAVIRWLLWELKKKWCWEMYWHRIGPIIGPDGKVTKRAGSCWCGWRGGF